MIPYILKSTFSLLLFWLVYKLILEKTSFHILKRFYLIVGVLVAISIPFITIQTNTINFYLSGIPRVEPVRQNTFSEPNANSYQGFNLNSIIIYSYVTVCIIMSIRALRQITPLLKHQSCDEFKGYKLVKLATNCVPFSFFNTIYVNKQLHDTHKIPEFVLEHEKAHLDQKHSYDVMFMELVKIIFWYNPIVYLYIKSVKLNHEFLADQQVLNLNVDLKTYQNSLLDYTQSHTLSITNSYYHPQLKKRLLAMKTKTSKTTDLLKFTGIIPLLIVVFFSCGKTETEVLINSSDEKISSETITEEVNTNTTKPTIYFRRDPNSTEEQLFNLNNQDLNARLAFIRASQALDQPPIYAVNGSIKSLEDVFSYIKKTPTAKIEVKKIEPSRVKLLFSNPSKQSMSKEELQKEYDKIFDLIKP